MISQPAEIFQQGTSPLHRWDARVKLPLTLLVILQIALAPIGSFLSYIVFFALVMTGTVIANLDPLRVVKRSLIVLPFSLAAVALVFTEGAPFIGQLPFVGWGISLAGTIRLASILFKSLISAQFAILLMMTTHFTDVLWAAAALKLPEIMVAIIGAAYRYLFILFDEASRLAQARDSRTAMPSASRRSARHTLFRAQTTGRMIGSLLLRALARGERVYQAMAARGYEGSIRRTAPPPLAAGDIGAGIAALLPGSIILFMSLLT